MLNKYIFEYEKLAIEHQTASMAGDYKNANNAVKKIGVIVNKVIREDLSDLFFSTLFSHSNLTVKMWAATSSELCGFDIQKSLQIFYLLLQDEKASPFIKFQSKIAAERIAKKLGVS